MQILSHRGYWQRSEEKNGTEAFRRSFTLGFGTETDLRDRLGEVVISHDPPNEAALSLAMFLDLYQASTKVELPLALNIKADGLAKLVRSQLEAAGILSRCFVFDMSIPDMLDYLRHGVPVFSRQSEYEREVVCYEQSQGVWMDCFHEDWFDEASIQKHLAAGKKVCLVSPDLHRRDPVPLWNRLAEMQIKCHPQLMICTDKPEEAATRLNGKG